MLYTEETAWADVIFSGEIPKDETIPLQPCLWCSAPEGKLSCLHSQILGEKKDQEKNLFSIRCDRCGAHSPLCESMEETASVWNSSTFNTDTNQKGQLTVRIIKDAKPKDKIYRLGDSNGLCLEVTPSGSKLWRLRYYFEGKAKMIGLGAFPETSLNKARKIRNEQQQTLKKGIDPSKERQKQQVNTKEVQEQAKIINKIDTLIRQLRNSKKSFKATTEPAE